MYLSTLTIENFRCFGSGAERLELHLHSGLTALVGENDKGKSAIIDALRFALGTTDQEWYRLEVSDFYKEDTSREIKIECKFEGLSQRDKRAFVEYLTYGEESGEEPVLFVNWTAEDTGEKRKGQPYRRVEVCSGKDGDGPTMTTEARDLLRSIYLRPLRDAEQALSAGRGSRLAQVLRHSDLIKNGVDEYDLSTPLDCQELSVLGIGKLVNTLLEEQQGVKGTRGRIDDNLNHLSLRGDCLTTDIKVTGANSSDEVRLRELLEKLDLRLIGAGKLGLGSNNLLFIACELLLLAEEEEGTKLLLIEEPEAHLHAQRQLRVMRFLQDQARKNGIQVIVTTHSPNLASAIDLDNMVMVHNGRAFSMAAKQTRLHRSDYRFLQRFLDVTKANLFFARGVMIVEGDAENILLPTLANLLGRDFTEHGVSIVNVGGVGLRRYARIFQRGGVEEEEREKQIGIPVACMTDLDVMPDCAPLIVGKVKADEEWPETNKRRWKTKKDITDMLAHYQGKVGKASGQSVKTFVSDEWTLEYSLALGSMDDDGCFQDGIAEDVYVAACLAEQDDSINAGQTSVFMATRVALKEFLSLKAAATATENCTPEEVLACCIYAKFEKDGVSKPIAAQYLAERLQHQASKGRLDAIHLRSLLPNYIVAAIDYVTSIASPMEPANDE